MHCHADSIDWKVSEATLDLRAPWPSALLSFPVSLSRSSTGTGFLWSCIICLKRDFLTKATQLSIVLSRESHQPRRVTVTEKENEGWHDVYLSTKHCHTVPFILLKVCLSFLKIIYWPWIVHIISPLSSVKRDYKHIDITRHFGTWFSA